RRRPRGYTPVPYTPLFRSAYVKLRRRGSIDFPIAGAAVAAWLDGETVTRCRVALSAVASHPLEARAAGAFLAGRKLDRETVREAAELDDGHIARQLEALQRPERDCSRRIVVEDRDYTIDDAGGRER